MTKQEAYDKAKTHLLAQNARSISGGYCKYRHGNLKCAAGVFIPDEQYTPSMEGWIVRGVAERFDLVFPHLDLVEELQQIHDTVPVPQWQIALHKLALQHGLIP